MKTYGEECGCSFYPCKHTKVRKPKVKERKMTRAERMRELRKEKTSFLERKRDRIYVRMDEAENRANELRAYYEDVNMILNEREMAEIEGRDR